MVDIESYFAAVDVFNGRFSEEEVNEVSQSHRTHKVRSWKNHKNVRLENSS